MPDIQTAADIAPAVPPPVTHPMDPRRGENLSPMFAASFYGAEGTSRSLPSLNFPTECIGLRTSSD